MAPETDAPERVIAGVNVFGERVYTTAPNAQGVTYVRADVAKTEALDLARRALRMFANNVDLQAEMTPALFAEEVEHFVEKAANGGDFIDSRAA